jgi:hypothetical protein
MGRQFKRYPGSTRVFVKVEVKLTCEALQKAFARKSVNEPSSDMLETPNNLRRTQQLLNEARNRERADAIFTATNHIVSITSAGCVIKLSAITMATSAGLTH